MRNLTPFADRDSAKEWIINNQLGRRNLPDILRVQLAKKLEPIWRERAKRNQRLHGGTAPGQSLSLNLAEVIHVDTRRELANAAKVSPQTFADAEKVIDNGVEELKDAVAQGVVSINAAEAEITSPIQSHLAGPFADFLFHRGVVGVFGYHRIAMTVQLPAAFIHREMVARREFDRGTKHLRDGTVGAAIECFSRSVSAQPTNDSCWHMMGVALNSTCCDRALAAFREAIRLNPALHQSMRLAGECLMVLGYPDEAVAMFRRAIAISPTKYSYDPMLYTMHLSPTVGVEELWRAHADFNERFARPLLDPRPHVNERSPNRRLRVGYVSPCFSEGAIATFAMPLLVNHDHEWFEVHCYSDGEPDDTTLLIRRRADVWHDTRGKPDAEFAEMVRGDGIDILVDLTAHACEANRMLVLARKPAPVQVLWMHPWTGGVEAIDYRLSDPYLDPPEAMYLERLVRLPDCYYCYACDAVRTAATVKALPAVETGHITFGALGDVRKLNDVSLSMFCRVMAAVPGSRLMIVATEQSTRQRVRWVLMQHGVSADRVTFLCWQNCPAYLETYNQIDISLSPFPHAGHTTVCDSMWMGVPAVSLFGQTAVSRGGLSILSNVGLSELATDDPERYVEIAVSLASDLDRLATLRRTLRDRLLASPLTDGPRFARNMEAAFRKMWTAWCAESR